MMPVAGQDPVLDAAAVKRKAHVRASVVEGDHIAAISHDQHGAAGRADHHAAAVAQLAERPDANEARAGVVHAVAPVGWEMNVRRPAPRFKCSTEAFAA
jgi:hypothetical protein